MTFYCLMPVVKDNNTKYHYFYYQHCRYNSLLTLANNINMLCFQLVIMSFKPASFRLGYSGYVLLHTLTFPVMIRGPYRWIYSNQIKGVRTTTVKPSFTLVALFVYKGIFMIPNERQ